ASGSDEPADICKRRATELARSCNPATQYRCAKPGQAKCIPKSWICNSIQVRFCRAIMPFHQLNFHCRTVPEVTMKRQRCATSPPPETTQRKELLIDAPARESSPAKMASV